MRLSVFISTHPTEILAEWDKFAQSCVPSATGMDATMLRDHAAEMLRAIASDLDSAQNTTEQADKAVGKSDADGESQHCTPAQSHGAERADRGFTVEQMVAEYRALRASVTRLWIDAGGELSPKDLKDLVRFNEAIDQALAESMLRFSKGVEESKDMFLAMLGHDLRTPLGAIISWADVLANDATLPAPLVGRASRIVESGYRMNTLVRHLLDFTRSRLGGGIPIAATNVDVSKVCEDMIAEIRGLYPQRVVNLVSTGELSGHWDGARIGQVLSNVLNNAVQHGAKDTPINVVIHGHTHEVTVAVHNSGPVIPTNELGRIFDPMHRIESGKPLASRSNLGLGLYIAERIVAAHGGTISVESSELKGTTFTIHLPKRHPKKAPLAGVTADMVYSGA